MVSNPALKPKFQKHSLSFIHLFIYMFCFVDYTEFKKKNRKQNSKLYTLTLFFKFYYFHTQLQAYHKHRKKMSLIRNQQFFNNFGINPAAAAASTTTTSPALSVATNTIAMTGNRRRSSNSNKSSLNRSYYIQSPSNNSSINSSCDSGSSNRASFIESDLLETNIKEIEYTLLGLMDNEAAAANRNSQRLASISSGNSLRPLSK